jgi:5-methyltetrahydrofolate--homocysteine methyltransferase
MQFLNEIIKDRFLIIDGAMGTQIQSAKIPQEAWEGNEGCNEFLNVTAPDVILKIQKAYCEAGADIIKTNTFGAMDWVLDEYDIGHRAYELAFAGAKLAKEAAKDFSHIKPRFIAGALGPGTKLPSLGHIDYDTMYAGYAKSSRGLIEGGVDLFLIETAQDPLQIKAALHAIFDTQKALHVKLPVMVSVTIELSGTMLIGTDAATIAAILEPFEIFSLGINCGTGPEQVLPHLKTLSEVWPKILSIHANAGLPQNRGGKTFYPMDEENFAKEQAKFSTIDGVAIMGGCCGTTPNHIKALESALRGKKPKPPTGKQSPSIASLFEVKSLTQTPPPFLVGERSNATGSKAFRELLLAQDFDGTLSVAGEQVRSGAHGLDVSVGFAGRDEAEDMKKIVSLYSQKTPLPLMVDTTQLSALEAGLKCIGGRPIINSVNLEDGLEKFDAVCSLAKRFGAALVCLTIDEKGMAKTKEQKVSIAKRIFQRAVNLHKLRPSDLVFDFLTFTVGSGDEEYRNAAIETIEAIKEFKKLYPEVGFVLGVSNISFGLAKHAREYLNSIFLHHCVQAGLTMAIVNVKNTLPLHKIGDAERKVCEDLLFNNQKDGDPLFAFIRHFEGVKADSNDKKDPYEGLDSKTLIHKLLIDGNKKRMLDELVAIKEQIAPEVIINEVLIGAMKEVGDLFGSGKMQLPFVLQSAEVMKAAVDYLKPFLPKSNKQSQATLILGTVKGDVHDVGKNLVDIILTNNGYKVINIGIKADIQTFIDAYHKHNAHALGMSGLLVKSTSVMKENLQTLKDKGINVPILLGGAALNDSFVEEYCRPNYDGPVFYCKDAFEGILAMSRIEKGNFDTKLSSVKKIAKPQKPKAEKKALPKDIKMPRRDIPVPNPPFWGVREIKTDVKNIAYEWINHKLLFSSRWGYSAKGLSKEEKIIQQKELLWPLFERLKGDIQRLDLFEPTLIYGYYPCRSKNESLYIFDESKGWNFGEKPSKTKLEEAIHILNFPRQQSKPYRCLSDFYHSEHDDVVAFTCVSAGKKFSQYEAKLYKEGKYQEYYLMHGLGVELAEALAEIVHKQIRLDLNIANNEGKSLKDVKMSRYQGCRYSFGYPACPEIADTRVIFDLLKPERFGIELSETFQIHPEQSTTAIVTYHPEALYFAT